MNIVTHSRQRDTAGMAGGHAHMPGPACAYTHQSAPAAESLSGPGDPAELWLTLTGSLHHTTSHLDACWLLDQTTGSWLWEENRTKWLQQNWKCHVLEERRGEVNVCSLGKVIKKMGTLEELRKKMKTEFYPDDHVFSWHHPVGVERVLSAKSLRNCCPLKITSGQENER